MLIMLYFIPRTQQAAMRIKVRTEGDGAPNGATSEDIDGALGLSILLPLFL